MRIKNLSIAALLLAGVAFAGCAGTGSGAGGGGGASTDTTVAPTGGT